MGEANGQVDSLQTWGADQQQARVVVLAVHGRGQNPEVMKEYSTHLDVPGLRFVAPRAVGDSWYPEPFLEPLAVNAEALEAGLEVVDRCLRQLKAQGWADGRIVLWGFSQGACLLSHHLLTRPPSVGAAILFTGGFVGREKLEVEAGPDLSALPVIVRSVQNDPFVPPRRVAETVTLLRRLGADVDDRIDPGDQHIITDEAYAAAGALLTTLAGPST